MCGPGFGWRWRAYGPAPMWGHGPYGFGRRRGWWGGGPCWGWGYREPTAEERRAWLESYKRDLEAELKWVEESLAEMD